MAWVSKCSAKNSSQLAPTIVQVKANLNGKARCKKTNIDLKTMIALSLNNLTSKRKWLKDLSIYGLQIGMMLSSH